MKTTTQKLTEWAITKIKKEYPDDIALLVAVDGNSVNGDGHGECFDYFVPATERGNGLAQTFIIDGVGHDLYPRTWERTERTAALDDGSTLCLGDARILYSRSEDDKNRFLALREKLSANLQNREYTYKKSLEKLDVAMNLYKTMMFENSLYKVRMAAGYITDYLSTAVAYLNGTYRTEWNQGKLNRYPEIKEIPENFIEYCDAVIKAQTIDELKNLSHLIISNTRMFISSKKSVDAKKKINSDFSCLADWYQELSLTWRRLRYYCDKNDYHNAFSDACFIQNEMLIVGEEFGLEEMDLMGSFDLKNLDTLKNRSTELENIIISVIESNGVKINRYDTVEEFLAKN